MKLEKTHKFQSEVKELLQLMIHSLYSKKEIFLRELISNASDAIDKLRFKSLSESNNSIDSSTLRIRIKINKEKKILIIRDNGIGMSYEEIINNLGTIAKSGTKSFLNSLNKNEKKKNQLIGQFGVGFYSAFMVAKKVNVRTRTVNMELNQGVFWESDGQGEYTVKETKKEEIGTEIILYLKDTQNEFLDYSNLKKIINKYSNYISVPIEIKVKDKEKKSYTWKKINKAQALWVRNKVEISKAEYNEFYKNLFNDLENPLTWTHNQVEGKEEYINLIYIPKKSQFDLWNQNVKYGLKIYIHRVFVMDSVKQFIPNYLRFVRGLIDSNDFPLNVSREILQNSSFVRKLKHILTKKILQTLEKLAKNETKKYQEFWNEFGLVLKEGIAEDLINKEKIANLLRFASTHNKSNIQNVSLQDYFDRMVQGQEKIFYISADNYTAAKNSPHLELYRKKNIEVLLLSDRIDEWVINYLPKFKEKSFQSINQNDDSLKDLIKENKEEIKEIDKKFKSFLDKAKNILKDKVQEVKLTFHLITIPSVVTISNDGITTQMAKIFESMGQSKPKIKYNFEINPHHPLIQKIIKLEDKKIFSKWIKVLFEQALFVEKGTLDNPIKFINRINKLLLLK